MLSIVALGLAAAPAPAQNFSDGYTFLKAVRERDGEKAQVLLAQPGSIVVNTRDRSTGEAPIHIVTRGRDLAWLGFLLGKGARPDLQDNAGNTPLHLAAQLGWTEGAELLLGRRASVDMTNRLGETPLIRAVQQRDVAMVRLLLARGADPTRPDSATGYSAIDYARRDSRAANILKLLDAPRAPLRETAGPKL